MADIEELFCAIHGAKGKEESMFLIFLIFVFLSYMGGIVRLCFFSSYKVTQALIIITIMDLCLLLYYIITEKIMMVDFKKYIVIPIAIITVIVIIIEYKIWKKNK